MKKIIGIDIGGTNTKIGVINQDGKVLDSFKFSTQESKNFNAYLSNLIIQIKDLLKRNNLKNDDLLGIGIGAPNGNYLTGEIENPTNIKGWGYNDIVSPLKDHFKISVKLDNDANVAAMGELYFGKGRGLKDIIVITIGTGVGTGVIANNLLIRGTNGIASEGGHIKIFDNSRKCGCGGYGHLESYVSLRGIKQSAKESIGLDLHFREIINLYKNKDPKILELIDTVAKQLSQGLSIMGCLFAPKKIIIAGGIVNIGEEFNRSVKNYYEKFIYPPFKNTTTICLSDIAKENGAIIGAASLILK